MTSIRIRPNASRCDGAKLAFWLLASGFWLLPLVSCDSEAAADRHASNRAVRSPMANSDPMNEVLAEGPHPFAVIELPNQQGGQPHLSTVVDPLIGRPTPTGPAIQPGGVTIVRPTGVQLQPTTSPATAPATTTAPATAPATNLPRGAADSTAK